MNIAQNIKGIKTFKAYKPIAALIGAVFILLFSFGCSDSGSKPPKELILGNWSYMGQSWCEFNDDNTCIIGGTAGEYKIAKDNSITMSVYTSDDELNFEWAGSADKADFKHWYVDEDTLYINGMTYPRAEGEAATAASATVGEDN